MDLIEDVWRCTICAQHSRSFPSFVWRRWRWTAKDDRWVGFFSLGLTRTCLWDVGKILCMNYALHMFAIICAREELSCFTSQAGIRFKEQCFTGDFGDDLGNLGRRYWSEHIQDWCMSSFNNCFLSVEHRQPNFLDLSTEECRKVARPMPEPLARAN